MADKLDCDIIINKFKLQLRWERHELPYSSSHYIHFWTDHSEKGMNSLIPLVMG